MADKTERYCRLVFKKYLEEEKGIYNAIWIDQSDTHKDPPDFYLHINDDKYAVEVTGIEVLRSSKHPKGSGIGEKTFISSWEQLANEAKSEAERLNSFCGHYSVIVRNIIVKKPFKKSKKRIIKELVDIFVRTKNDLKVEEKVIIDDIEFCHVSKTYNHYNSLEVVSLGSPAAIHSEDNVNKVSQLIQKCIDEKIGKLKKKGIIEPKILIINNNTYPSADVETYRLCKDKLTDLDYYFAVFIVIWAGELYCLHSEEW